MTYEDIYQLFKSNTAIRLVTADTAPLILSFLFKMFKAQNSVMTDAVHERELHNHLVDFLYQVNETEFRYVRQAKDYLTEWTNAGFLRKYPGSNDEFLFELTPATETAFKWLDSLNKPEFVGTESRLKNLFEKLKELATKTKKDYTSRYTELEAKRKAVEKEIEDLKQGKFEVLDDRQIKEQYLFIEETAKHLLADFRQVEDNFRILDRDFRKKIITTTQTKGKVLEDLFRQQDFLMETDQGKSFMAFWEFLLSQSRQDEFEDLIGDVLNIPVVQQMQKEHFSIENIRNNLIDAGDKTKKTTNSLLEQLRKYLEHRSFFENKRIHDNITEILKIITEHPETNYNLSPLLELDQVIKIDLITGRSLFKSPQKVKFTHQHPEEGIATDSNDLLFTQFEISMPELQSRIKAALKSKSQITLPDFLKEFEIEKGVAEVVAYVEIASKERHKHLIDETVFDIIDIKNTRTNKHFKVKVPQIIFCR